MRSCRSLAGLAGSRPDLHYVRSVISGPEEVTLVLADGQHFFREGLRGVLEAAGARVVGEATDGEQALELVSQLKPRAIVIDSNMRGENDSSILRELADASPQTRLVVLGRSTEARAVLRALESGACAYLLRDAAAEELAGGVDRAIDGQVLLSSSVALALVKSACEGSAAEFADRSARAAGLTQRELDVLRLVVQGDDNAEIGQKLSISHHTVKRHIKNLCVKLGVDGRLEAAVYAVRNGLA